MPGVEPPKEQLLTRASAYEGLRTCFGEHYGKGDPSVRVSVKGTLILTLADDGKAASARFDPPLAPPFQSCVWGAVSAGRFEGGASPRTLSVPFEFGR
jgi:hypothetical protein